MLTEKEVIVIDDSDDAGNASPSPMQAPSFAKESTPAQGCISFVAMARSAGSIIFGKREREDDTPGPPVLSQGWKGDPIGDSTALGENLALQHSSHLQEVGRRRHLADPQLDADTAINRENVEVKTESQDGHWERDSLGHRKWVGAHAVSGPIAERAAGNNDGDRLLSYNKKEGRDRCKLKLAAQHTASQPKKDFPLSKVWTPNAVEHWKRLMAICEPESEGTCWQREGSSLVGKRARSSKKTKGKRDGFIIAWCCKDVSVLYENAAATAADTQSGMHLSDSAGVASIPGSSRPLPAPQVIASSRAECCKQTTGEDATQGGSCTCLQGSAGLSICESLETACANTQTTTRKTGAEVRLETQSAAPKATGSDQACAGPDHQNTIENSKGTKRRRKMSGVAEIVVGSRIKGMWRAPEGGRVWYAGTVQEATDNETFSIIYDDGDVEADVKRCYVKPISDPRPVAACGPASAAAHAESEGDNEGRPSRADIESAAMDIDAGAQVVAPTDVRKVPLVVDHEQLLPEAVSGSREEDAEERGFGSNTGWLTIARSVLNRLMQHRKAPAFLQPVDSRALALPDYDDIITHPMDLGTISDRLCKSTSEGGYPSEQAWLADVRLVFANAIEYNGPRHPVGIAASTLGDYFERLWCDIKAGRHEGDRGQGRKEGKGSRTAAESKASNAAVKTLEANRTYLMVFFDGKIETMTYEGACSAIQEVIRASHSTFTYGFTLEFALREAVAKKNASAAANVDAQSVTDRSAEAGAEGAKACESSDGPKVAVIDMSIDNSSSHNMNGTSYTTSISRYETAWDSMAGDFIHRKIMGQREINGQTALSADCTDLYFPVLASIFNRFPLTKTELPFKDEESGQIYVLSAIAYNRRMWMRTGSCTEFHHGGLMLAQGWSRFRKAHGLGVGDTVILSRNQDNELIIGYRRGADPELLNSLSCSHYAVKAQMASMRDDPNALRDGKRMSMKPSKYMPEKSVAGAWRKSKGKMKASSSDCGAKVEDEMKEPVLSLKVALKEYGDRPFLADWRPLSEGHRSKVTGQMKSRKLDSETDGMQDKNIDAGDANSETAVRSNEDSVASISSLVEWEHNVVSEITEYDANFEYIPRNYLFTGDDEFARTQLFRRVSVLLNHARDNFCKAEPCSCSAGGKCIDFHTGPGGQGAARAPVARGDGGMASAAAVQEGESRFEVEEEQEGEKAKKPDCTICNDSGWKQGDDEAKRQLQHGPPFRLRVVSAEGPMGAGVMAEEFIPKGKAVCEYTGELIRGQEVKIREKVYMAAGLYYLFDLEVGRYCSMPWCVDATRKGNVARFVNHRCGETSNCEIKELPSSVMYKRDDAVPGRLALWTKRDIRAGEFLNYDYKTLSEEWEQVGYTMRKVVVCKCGSPHCRGWVL